MGMASTDTDQTSRLKRIFTYKNKKNKTRPRKVWVFLAAAALLCKAPGWFSGAVNADKKNTKSKLVAGQVLREAKFSE